MPIKGPSGLNFGSLGRMQTATRSRVDPLAEYMPGQEAIQQEVEKQKQEEETPFIFDLLELPSKILGFHSITGGIEAAIEGENVGEAIARGSPFAFLSDALGISDDFFGEDTVAQKTYTRDIRLAAGHDDVDDGWHNFVLNMLGDIALDPASFVSIGGRIPGALARVDGAGKGIIDAGKGVMRPAFTLEEGVKHGLNAFMTFKVPFMEVGFRVPIMTKNFELRTARSLTNMGNWMRTNPVTGTIWRTFSSRQHAVTDPTERWKLSNAHNAGDQAREAIRHEAYDILRGIHKRVGHHMGREEHLAVIDFIEHNVKSTDDMLDVHKKMEQGYRYWKNQLNTRELFAANPRLRELRKKAKSGDLDALQELYDEGVPLKTKELDRIGATPRPGLDTGGHPAASPTVRQELEGVEKKYIDDLEEDLYLVKDPEAFIKSAVNNELSSTKLERARQWRKDGTTQGHGVAEVHPDGRIVIGDGRHRLQAAGEAGEQFYVKMSRKSARHAEEAGFAVSPTGQIRQTMPTEDVLEKARVERHERMGHIKKAIDEGKYTLQDLTDYTEKTVEVLQTVANAEKRAGLLNKTLELYFPRQLAPEARELLSPALEATIRSKYGDGPWSIVSDHLKSRKFQNHSTTEVELIIATLGSKVTGYSSIRQLHELFGSKEFKRHLKKAPEILDFLNVDVTTAVLKRVDEGSLVLEKAKVYDSLFDPVLGIARHTTDSRDYARNKHIMETEPELIPMVQKEGRSVTFQTRAEVLDNAMDATQRGQINATHHAVQAELNERLLASKSDRRVLREHYHAEKKLNTKSNLTAADSDSILGTQKKRKLQERNDILAMRNEARKARKSKLDMSKGAKFQINPNGDVFWDGEMAHKMEPGVGSVVADYQEAALEIRYAEDLTNAEKLSLQKDLAKEANRNIAAVGSDYEAELLFRLRENKRKLNEIDSSFERIFANELAEKTDAVSHMSESMRKLHKDVSALRGRLGRPDDKVNEHFLHRVADDARSGLREVRPDELEEISKLKGMELQWVHKDTAVAMQKHLKEMASPDKWRNVFKWLDRTTAWWKKSTVAFPQSRARDFISNIFLLGQGGFKSFSAIGDWKNMRNAHKRMLNEGVSAEEAFEGVRVKIRDRAGKEVEVDGKAVFDGLGAHGLRDSSYVRDLFQSSIEDRLDLMQKSQTTLGKVANVADVLNLQGLRRNFTGKGRDSFFVQSMMSLGTKADNFTKGVGFLDALKRGMWTMGPDGVMDFTEAAAHVKKFVPGATFNTLSPTEKHTFMRLIPFYNWLKFSTGLMADQFLKKPGSMAVFEKFRNNAETFGLGGDPVGKDWPEDLLAARLVNDRMAIPWRRTKDGPEYFILDSYLPHAEIPQVAQMVAGALNTLVGIGGGDERFFGNATGTHTLQYFKQRLTPALKEMMEQLTGEDSYTQREIASFEGESSEMYGVVMNRRTRSLIENIRFLKEVDRLNLFNLEDFRATPIVAVNANPRGGVGDNRRKELSLLSRVSTGAFGALPRGRLIDEERELRYAQVSNSINMGTLRAKMGKRKEKGDRRTAQADSATLTELMTELKAIELRLKEVENQRQVGAP